MAGSDADGKVDPVETESSAPGAARHGSEGWEEDAKRITQRATRSGVTRAERDHMVKKAREVKFPVAVRGYDRAAVDRYVREVNRVIAELEISTSAESAVRHALAEVSEETREILQRAHETADEIVLRGRAKAADSVQEAEREAEEIRNAARQEAIETRDAASREAEELLGGTQRQAAELRTAAERDAAELQETVRAEAEEIRTAAKSEAEKRLRDATEKADQLLKSTETRTRELGENADLIWRERRRLIEDVRVLGEQLLSLGEAEAKRFARPTTRATGSAEEPLEASTTDADLAAALHVAVEENARPGS